MTNLSAQIALSIEQMLKLRTLGLDISDCKLAWCPLYLTNGSTILTGYYLMDRMEAESEICETVWPTYTLEEIMLKLPHSELRYNKLMPKNRNWVASIYIKDKIRAGCLISRSHSANTPMDAIFGVLEVVLMEYPEIITSNNTKKQE